MRVRVVSVRCPVHGELDVNGAFGQFGPEGVIVDARQIREEGNRCFNCHVLLGVEQQVLIATEPAEAADAR